MKRTFFLWILLLLVSGATAQNFDINTLKKLNAPDPSDSKFWLTVTNSINVVPAAYLIGNIGYGLADNNSHAYRYALEGTLSIGFSTLLMEALKITVKRPRPTTTYPDLIRSYSETRSYSFPSGHSSLAFSTATTMSYQIARPAVNVPIFVWPVSVGYSRMRLGKHYPSDVLAGTIIGIGGGILSHWVTTKIVK